MNTHTSIWVSTVLAALTAACGGGQVGEETAVCETVARTRLSLDAVSPLGFAPADVLAVADGGHRGRLSYASGDVTELELEVSFPSGSAYFEERAIRGSSTGAEIDEGVDGCMDRAVLAVDVSVASGDGAMAEQWGIEAAATTADAITIERSLPALTGSLDVAAFAPPPPWSSLSGRIRLEVGGALSGRLWGTVTREGAESVSAEAFEIGIVDPLP